MKLIRLKSFLIAGLLALPALMAAPIAAAMGIGLQPTTVEVTLQPGEQQRQAINIVNVHQEKTISLTIGLADWTLDEAGQIELAPPGDLEMSGAGWARFSPGFLTLEPGQSGQIIVDMATPARIRESGDYRFALLASTILPDERDSGSGVWRRYQLASLFYITTGDAESLPEIVSSGITLDDAGNGILGMRVENEGNAHARLNGTLEVVTPDDVKAYPISNLVVLDNGARNYKLVLGDPVPEDAEIRIQLDNTFAPQTAIGAKSLEPYQVAWSPQGLQPPVLDVGENVEGVAAPERGQP